jgi:hypothetical protein
MSNLIAAIILNPTSNEKLSRHIKPQGFMCLLKRLVRSFSQTKLHFYEAFEVIRSIFASIYHAVFLLS